MTLSRHLAETIQASQQYIGASLFTFKESGSIITKTVLERIENDPHIRAVLEKRYSGVANKRTEVIARSHLAAEAKGEPTPEIDYEETRGVDIVDRVLSYTNLSDGKRWLMRSRLAGVSVVVVDWVIRDGLIVPWFRPADYDWIGFRRVGNEAEDVSRVGQYAIVVGMGGMGKPVPSKRAIACNYGSRTDNPWGWGLGESLFYLKDIRSEMMKFALIHGDRFASPITVTEEAAGNILPQSDRDDLAQWLDKLTQQAYAVLPPGVSVKTVGGERSGGDFYLDTFDKIGNEISRLVLGETGTSDQSGGGGSRARDEVAADQQEGILAADCSSIDATLSETLAHWIVELNAPGATPPIIRTVWPKDKEGEISLKKSSADALKISIENYKSLTEMGFVPEEIDESPFEGWVQPKAAPGEDGEDDPAVQATALNGAQISSLQGIIEAVSEGRVPPDTGKYLIKAGFPSLSIKMIDRMIDPVRKKLEAQAGPSRWDQALGAGQQGEDEEPSEFAIAPLETRYEHIDPAPPEPVKAAIQAAIERRKTIPFKQRAADIHLQTALRLSAGKSSPDDLRALSDWFNRMESRNQHRTDKGRQAWELRGGDAGREWVDRLTEEFESADLGIIPEPAPPEPEPMEFAAPDEEVTPISLKKTLTPAANESFNRFAAGVAGIIEGADSLEAIRDRLDSVEYDPALGVLMGGAMSAAHVVGINQVKGEIADVDPS